MLIAGRREAGRGGSRIGPSGTLLDTLGRVPGNLGVLTWATRYARTRGGQKAVFTRREMEKPQVSGYSDGQGSAHCKTVGLAYVGSNPTPATQNPRSDPVQVYPEAGSDVCPGAVRQTADDVCGPVVGQIWPGQRPAAERARSRASRARFRKADLSGGCSRRSRAGFRRWPGVPGPVVSRCVQL